MTAAVQLPQLRLALQPMSGGLPVLDLSAQNLRRLLADVDAALEADRAQREALRAALDETHQLRDSLVSRSAVMMDVSMDRSADDNISLQSSFSGRPDPRAQRILQLEQHVQLLTDRLRERERERMNIDQQRAHGALHSRRVVAHTGTQTPETETATATAASGAVYNRQAVQIAQLEAQLQEERERRYQVERDLEDCRRGLATAEDRAQADARRLEALLTDCRYRVRELEAERGIADSHKESLISALRHERSLFGFAVARLERHGIDTAQLLAMQKQCAHDLSPLSSAPPMPFSLPSIPVLQPGRGDDTPTGSTPRQLEEAQPASAAATNTGGGGGGNNNSTLLVIGDGVGSVGTPPGSPIVRNETRSVTPDELSDGQYNTF